MYDKAPALSYAKADRLEAYRTPPKNKFSFFPENPLQSGAHYANILVRAGKDSHLPLHKARWKPNMRGR